MTAWLAGARDAAGWTTQQMSDLFAFRGNRAQHWVTQGKPACVPSPAQWDRLREELRFDDTEIRDLVAVLNARKGELGDDWVQREVIGRRNSGLANGVTSVFLSGTSGRAADRSVPVTAPASDAARQWQGWHTSLKPAHEPIVVARKSTGFNTTVANVLEHGTGALNVDACRTAAGQDYRDKCASVIGIGSPRNGDALGDWTGVREDSAHDAGRWPTNILLGHSPACGVHCAAGCPVPDLGAEARFFPAFRYEAKAPASERPRLADGTAHATVKPLALMRWLIRLVTPPGGTVLDPFAGSGTTLEAAAIEGFRAVGIELEAAHAELCRVRLVKAIEPVLFGDAS